MTPASAAACLHQGLRPAAFSSQEILIHTMSNQLLPTMPPVSPLFWFQHLRRFSRVGKERENEREEEEVEEGEERVGKK